MQFLLSLDAKEATSKSFKDFYSTFRIGKDDNQQVARKSTFGRADTLTYATKGWLKTSFWKYETSSLDTDIQLEGFNFRDVFRDQSELITIVAVAIFVERRI